jgi:hypothetical protein
MKLSVSFLTFFTTEAVKKMNRHKKNLELPLCLVN